MKKKPIFLLPLLLALSMLLGGCVNITLQTADTTTVDTITDNSPTASYNVQKGFDFDAIPAFEEKPYVVLNDNIPDFDKSDMTTSSYEVYGKLDALGRCTACSANIGKELMPTEKRGAIGSVKPTGWHTVKYDGIDGNYLYNRCHLIGYQLSGENANERNLITGTRYMNAVGMLPFEEEVAYYVKSTNHHVLYRVTPLFQGNELVARGVQMEAYSVEDNGRGVCFNVFCYNNQPGIEIDYRTGESKRQSTAATAKQSDNVYVVNKNSKKFHKPTCNAAKSIKKENKLTFTGERARLIGEGYTPCSQCRP